MLFDIGSKAFLLAAKDAWGLFYRFPAVVIVFLCEVPTCDPLVVDHSENLLNYRRNLFKMPR
jgi:hypothetical protein